MIEEYIGAPGAELSDSDCENEVISALVRFWTSTSNFEEPKEIRYTYFCENVDTYNSDIKSLDVDLNETGKKESEGKTDYSEINLGILDIMAERFNANKHKYPKGNMKKPIEVDGLLWAAFRHLKKMIKPLKDDQEDFKQHLAAVLCNMSMILDQIELKDESKI